MITKPFPALAITIRERLWAEQDSCLLKKDGSGMKLTGDESSMNRKISRVLQSRVY
jgi:hypothetical protein